MFWLGIEPVQVDSTSIVIVEMSPWWDELLLCIILLGALAASAVLFARDLFVCSEHIIKMFDHRIHTILSSALYVCAHACGTYLSS